MSHRNRELAGEAVKISEGNRPRLDPMAHAPSNAAAAPGAVPGDDRRARVVVTTAGAVLLLYGVGRAISLAWLCDDSFISIRYAEHFASGLGLVYNAGERVEGYTNLSWTLLLAAAARLGASPEAVASGNRSAALKNSSPSNRSPPPLNSSRSG